MNVAVLGATGFLGAWAVRALLSRGAQVSALARPTSDVWRIDGLPGLQIVRTSDFAATIRELAPDAMLSLDWAGVAAPHRNEDSVQMANVLRQGAIVDAALSAGTQILVGVGSQAEYGPLKSPVSEDRATAPVTAYGRAKVAASSALAGSADAAGVRWAWARVFSVFGPLETGGWLLPSIARSVAAGVPMHMSSGTQPWSYLYAADAGTALAELVLNPEANGIYHVGHPASRPLRESVATFVAALEGEKLLEFGTNPGEYTQPVVRRLQSLGWAPTTPVDLGLETTARWLQGVPVADPLLHRATLPAAPAD